MAMLADRRSQIHHQETAMNTDQARGEEAKIKVKALAGKLAARI
jgi:hypothetical protein